MPLREPPSAADHPFLLEDTFQDPAAAFAPTPVASVRTRGVMVALDTNVLLLPYATGKDDLSAIAGAYRKLAGEQRLFLPARAAREFARHRDGKVAELIQKMQDASSRIAGNMAVSSILEKVDGYDELKKAAKAHAAAFKRVRAGIEAWRGDDPVTALYAEVFRGDTIVEHDDGRDDSERAQRRDALRREWDVRRASRVPPGYKDKNKPDTGIGDYLIWRTLLRLGREQGKDLVFVTGDEKADWFVRAGDRGLFARPELVAEYRRASGGRGLRLCGLSELLAEFGAGADVVGDVRLAEDARSRALRALTADMPLPRPGDPVIVDSAGSVCTPRGTPVLLHALLEPFEFMFSTTADGKPTVLPMGMVDALVHLQGIPRGGDISFVEFGVTGSGVGLQKNDVFAARNLAGEVLVARVARIESGVEPRVCAVYYDYRIYLAGAPLIAP